MKRVSEVTRRATAPWLGGLAMLLLASTASAGGDGKHGFGAGGRGEGFMAGAEEACEGKQAGTAVTLTGPEGQSTEAVCTLRPAVLLAVPKAHLERLEKAKAACKGLIDGAAATLTTADGQNVAATCKLRHGELMAVPNERPRKR